MEWNKALRPGALTTNTTSVPSRNTKCDEYPVRSHKAAITGRACSAISIEAMVSKPKRNTPSPSR